MTSTKKSVTNSVSADFRNQLDSLRSHEEQLQASEVTRIVAITLAGRCLANMRDELKKQGISDWEKRLAQEARLPGNELQRRILIGTHWAGSIETAQMQALLAQLPAETLKLECICKIPMAELPSFLSKHDCRRLDRESVRKAVQAHLGVANVLREFKKVARRVDPVVKTLTDDQLDELLGGLNQMFTELLNPQADEAPEATEPRQAEGEGGVDDLNDAEDDSVDEEDDVESEDDEPEDDESEDDEPTSRRS
jgi:hypothetical protein